MHFYAVRPEATEFDEKPWNNAKQGPLRSPRSFKVTGFGTNRKLIYDFLLVINTNLPSILHRFGDIACNRTKIAIFGYPLTFNSPDGGFPWDNLRKIFRGCQWVAKLPNGVCRKFQPAEQGAQALQTDRQTDRQTDDRQTVGRQHIANVNVR